MVPSHVIEDSGVWWIAGKPSKQATGILRFDENEWFVLTLTTTDEVESIFESSKEYDIIHGKTVNGTKYSLCKCFVSSTRRTLQSFDEILQASEQQLPRNPVETKVHSRLVFQGFHLPSLVDPIIRNLTAEFEFLNRWTKTEGFKVRHKKTFPNFDVSYRKPKKLKVDLLEGFSLSFNFHPNIVPFGTTGFREIKIREDVDIQVQFKNSQSISHFQEQLRILQDFFSVAFLRLSLPTKVVVEGDFDIEKRNGEDEYPRGQVFYKISYSDSSKESPSYVDLLFRKEDVSNELTRILHNWFSKAERLKTTRNLYSASIYTDSLIESKFLLLCQAFESYHRRFYDALYMKPKKFQKEVCEPLIKAIPSHLASSFRTSIKNSLKFLNEHSLSKRLKSIIKENKEALKNHIKNLDIAQEIVDMRNYLTHYPVEKQDFEIDYRRLHYLTNVLKFIMELCFLKEMGFSKERIVELTSQNETYKQELRFHQ